MSELKTLKELEGLCCGAGEYCKYDGSGYQTTEKSKSVHSYDLKQEAIKHIKDEESQTLDSTDAWIKYFFNLTEEDLE